MKILHKIRKIDLNVFFEKYLPYVFWVSYLIYAVFQGYLYLMEARVPDEIWFSRIFNEINQGSFVDILSTQNQLGYGSFYWIVGGIINDFYVLRVLSLLYMISIPLFIIGVGRKIKADKCSIFLAGLLFLTFPAAWWYGKLIGPELMSVFFGLLGVYFAFYKNKLKWVGFTLLTMSAGIKLNGMIFMFFTLVYLFPLEGLKIKNWKTLLLKYKTNIFSLFCFGLLGGLISNPFLVFHPLSYFETLSSFMTSSSLRNIGNLFYDNHWHWDGVFRGGLFNLSIGIIPFFIFMFRFKSIKIQNKKLFISLLATLLFCIIMFLRQRYLGWYWYPYLVLIPLFIFMFEWNKHFFKVLLFIFIVNIFFQLPLIEKRVKMRLEHNTILNSRDEIVACINQYTSKDSKIYNFSEFYLYPEPIQYDMYADIKGSKFFSPPYFLLLGNRLMKPHKDLQLHNVFSNLNQNNNCVEYINSCSGINIIGIATCK